MLVSPRTLPVGTVAVTAQELRMLIEVGAADVPPDVMPDNVPASAPRPGLGLLESVGDVDFDTRIGNPRCLLAHDADEVGIDLDDVDVSDIGLSQNRLEDAAEAEAIDEHAPASLADRASVVAVLIMGIAHPDAAI